MNYTPCKNMIIVNNIYIKYSTSVVSHFMIGFQINMCMFCKAIKHSIDVIKCFNASKTLKGASCLYLVFVKLMFSQLKQNS